MAFSDKGAILIGSNNVTIKNVHMSVNQIASTNGNHGMKCNRYSCITDSTDIENLSILDSYINGTSTLWGRSVLGFTSVNGLNISGNYISVEYTAAAALEGIAVYYLGGEVSINNNEVYYPAPTAGIMRLGFANCSLTTTSIEIIGNTFAGNKDNTLTTNKIAFGIAPTGKVTIRGNVFKNFATLLSVPSNTAKFDVQYNIYDSKSVGTADASSTHAETVVKNNCYLNTATTVGKNDYIYANSLINAYNKEYPTESINWSLTTYTIKYDTDGAGIIDSVQYTDFTTITLPTPTKEGHTFQGWYDGETLIEAIDEYRDYNLKASWLAEGQTATYIITYNAGKGTSTLESQEYEENTVVTELPTATYNKYYTFVGWFENEDLTGDAVTSLTVTGNKTLYAKYTREATTITIGAGEPYTTINSALADAMDGDVFVLLEGTYAEDITITKSITIEGPYKGVKGTETRKDNVDEATLTGLIYINASDVIIDGIKCTDNAAIRVGGNNVTIKNVYMAVTPIYPATDNTTSRNNRKGCIVDSVNISNLTIKDSYIKSSPTTGNLTGIFAFTHVTNLTVTGNYLTSASTNLYEAIMIYTMVGENVISYNELYSVSTQGLLRIGNSAFGDGTTDTTLEIVGNTFGGSADGTTAVSYLWFDKVPSKATDNIAIRGNVFMNFSTGNGCIRTATSGTYNMDIEYNIFDANSVSVIRGTTTGITVNNNYYMNSEIEATDANKFTNANALINAYKVAYPTESINWDLTTYTIKYDTDGGDAIADATFTNVEEVVLPTPIKTGFIFEGWYDGETLVENIDEYKDYNLKASWRAEGVAATYKITYNAGKGTSTLESQEYEENTVVTELPTATYNSYYTFAGWYENADFSGAAVTSLTVTGHKTLYAKYTREATTITVGENEVYTTLAAALADAMSGDKFVVLAGTYAEDVTIAVDNITIEGPNKGVAGTATRATEADITGVVTISADDVELNGLGLSGTSAIQLDGANNVTVTNIYSTSEGTSSGDTSEYIGVIYSSSALGDAASSDIEISNSYFYSASTTAAYHAIALHSKVSNLTIANNKIKNSLPDSDTAIYADAIRVQYPAGEVVIKGNTVNFTTYNYDITMGRTANEATKVVIRDNVFSNQPDTCGIEVRLLPAGSVTDIVGNTVENLVGSMFNFSGSVSGSVINIKYNNFSTGTAYKMSVVGNATINYYGNSYAEMYWTSTATSGNNYTYAQNTMKCDYNTRLTDEERELAYLSDKTYNPDKAYTLTLNNNGTITTQAATINHEYTLPTLTSASAIFLGWATAVDSTDYITTYSQTTNTDVTLYACWQERTEFYVTYDANGGTVTKETDTFSDYSTYVLLTPTRDNYIFAGWYEGETLVEALTEKRDYALVAEWYALGEVTVNYTLNGGLLEGTPVYDSQYDFVLMTYGTSSNFLSGYETGLITKYYADVRTNYTWYRIVVKYNETLGLYETVQAPEQGLLMVTIAEEGEYVIAAHSSNNTDTTSYSQIKKVYELIRTGAKVYFEFVTPIPSSTGNTWNSNVKVYVEEEAAETTQTYKTDLTLPTPTRDKYVFAGWYDNAEFNGEKIETITVGTETETKNLYAKWVEQTFEVGEGKEYSTIQSAIDAAYEGATITVFAGTYNETLTIKKALTIVGPNKDIHGASTSRVAEAVITGTVNINATDVTLNGLKLSGTSTQIILAADTSTVSGSKIYRTELLCLNMPAYASTTVGSNTYMTSIYTAQTVYYLTIEDSYISGSFDETNAKFRPIYITAAAQTTNIINNTIEDDSTNLGIAIQIPTISGTVNIKNNTVNFVTGNYTVYVGGTSNTASTSTNKANVTIQDNYFGCASGSTTSGIRVDNIQSGKTCNIIGNVFENVTGGTLNFRNSVAGSTANVKYNYYKNTSYTNSYPGSGTIEYVSNYYGTAQTTATNTADTATTLSGAATAYKAEYGVDPIYVSEVVE